jgi:hypothetical protein
MPDTFSLNIRRFRGFRRIKQAQTFSYAVRAYTRLKTVLSFGYAKPPTTVAPVRRNLILDVFSGRDVAQVFQSIIVWVSVNVVNVVFRPFTIYVKPNQSVRPITLTVNADYAVPKVIYGSGNAANHYAAISFNAPAQHARRRIANKQFFKTFMREHIVTPMVLSCSTLARTSRVKAP